jgi:hypothetical protein
MDYLPITVSNPMKIVEGFFLICTLKHLRENILSSICIIYYKLKLIEWQLLFIVPISIFYRNQADILRWISVGVHYCLKWHLFKLFETGLGLYGNVCFWHEEFNIPGT